jgi:hypothetical protein
MIRSSTASLDLKQCIARGSNHTVPTGRIVLKRFPGNELPGYDHLVPTGRDASSLPIPGNKLPGVRRAQSSRFVHSVPPGLILWQQDATRISTGS